MTDLTGFLEERFGDLWPAHTRAFGDLLICAREHFEGDLDKLLIMAVIGSRSWDPATAQGMHYRDYRSRSQDSPGGQPPSRRLINIQSISTVTGIPRESVRRKVNAMLERGWIEWNDRGLVASAEAASQFSALTDATFDYLATILQALDVAPGAKPPDGDES